MKDDNVFVVLKVPCVKSWPHFFFICFGVLLVALVLGIFFFQHRCVQLYLTSGGITPLKSINYILNHGINHVTTSRNKGSIPQSLICCRLAGWVKDKQFSFQIPQNCENSPEAHLSSFPINEETLSKAAINSYNVSGEATYESLNNEAVMKNGIIPGTAKYCHLKLLSSRHL